MTEEKQTNVNLNINDGDAFFANEVSINFNPLNFFVDFKCVSPRIDPRNQTGATFSLKHNVIILEPYAVKELSRMMDEIVGRYEKEFGKIEKSKAAKEADKMRKKTKAKAAPEEKAPGYFG
jgi:hypothetical protein